jgi:Mn2+/Fe2+ NRAMP family transporter
VPVVFDWYLAQAGFREQLQLYSETFWRQAASVFVWASLVIWFLLIVVAIVITLSRQAEATEEQDSPRRWARIFGKTRTESLRPRTSRRHAGTPHSSSGKAA